MTEVALPPLRRHLPIVSDGRITIHLALGPAPPAHNRDKMGAALFAGGFHVAGIAVGFALGLGRIGS
jgi:hypothetical protein